MVAQDFFQVRNRCAIIFGGCNWVAELFCRRVWDLRKLRKLFSGLQIGLILNIGQNIGRARYHILTGCKVYFAGLQVGCAKYVRDFPKSEYGSGCARLFFGMCN